MHGFFSGIGGILEKTFRRFCTYDELSSQVHIVHLTKGDDIQSAKVDRYLPADATADHT